MPYIPTRGDEVTWIDANTQKEMRGIVEWVDLPQEMANITYETTRSIIGPFQLIYQMPIRQPFEALKEIIR
jgi:hypothetical protein